ncbi:MAG TPA: DUF1573 domain-containing protein [Fimbriimonas sp.]|nr:DUF1573 domain-containing protein [Fimbriimonas sp.]
MRLLPYFFLVLLVAGCEPSDPATAVSNSQASGPRLEVLTPEVDLGTIKTEDVHHASFKIKNSGSKTLNIDDVMVGCGCTLPEFPKTVGAGEEAEIKVTFQPQPLWKGKRSDKVTIQSNGGSSVVKLNSVLAPALDLSKTTPLMANFVPGHAATYDVIAKGRDFEGPPIVSAVSEDPRLTVKLEQRVEDSVLHVTIGALNEPGDLSSKLVLTTKVPSLPETNYFVTAQASDGPISSPSKIRMPALPGGAKGKLLASLSVYSRKNPISVLKATTSDPAIEIKKLASTAAHTTPIRVTYRGGWKPGKHEGIILIQTDSATYPILKVPYLIDKVY